MALIVLRTVPTAARSTRGWSCICAPHRIVDVPPIGKRNLSQRTWRVEVQIKTIRERNRAPRSVYKLLRLLGEVEPGN